MIAEPVHPRRRVTSLALIVLTIALGLASRRFAWLLPAAIQKSAGDALWALMVFWGAGFLFPRKSTLICAALAMTFSTLIEVSQLYHAPWIDSIRSRTLGHLVLGSGFAASDLLAYAAGVGCGINFEWVAPSGRQRLQKADREMPPISTDVREQ